MKTFIPRYMLPVLILLVSSCTNDAGYKNITRLNYGTSFGECVGFCKHEVTIRSNKATFTCYSIYPTAQTLTKTDSIKITTLDSIYSLNTSTFFNLPETIGCPDCADGGAEWLEVELTNGTKHKVTFEYQHEPTSLQNQIQKLREVLSKNECK
jgi:hypothetical protein